MSIPTISVLLATRNRPRLLHRSVARILAGRRLPDELIVVDQSDGTHATELPEAPACVRLRHIRIDEPGKSRAINLGLEASTGSVLAFTDDDVLVDEGWLEAVEQLHREHPEFDGFCGRVLPEPGTSASEYVNLVPELDPRVIDRSTNPVLPSVCGANLTLRRAAFVRAGGLNPSFGPGHLFRSNDDGELAYRLTRRGSRIRFSPELVVFHMGWRRDDDNRALTWDYAFSLGGFAGFYLRRADPGPTAYLARMLVFKALALAVSLFRGDIASARSSWTHLCGISSGFVRGLRTSRDAEVVA